MTIPSRDPAADAGGEQLCARNHRILFDCTETADSTTGTGIQRAVRSIGGALQATRPFGAECVAVVYDGTTFVALADGALDSGRVGGRSGRSLRERLRDLVTRGYRNRALRATVLHAQVLSALRQTHSSVRWKFKRYRAILGRGSDAIGYRAGDWIVLLDSTWGPDLRGEIKRAKAAGARVCVVVYDLIQIHHAELVSPGAGAIYRSWFERTIPLADSIMTISRSVRDDLLCYLRERPELCPEGMPEVRWFHLGSDIRQPTGAGPPSGEVAKLFSAGHSPTFLVVGTLEQRKDQSGVLDAFEERWASGDTARLVLVGREGWGSHGLTRRLARHPERGTRLFWLPHASDADLEMCYRHATAVILASYSEGFGLPIVEALQRGVQVIAADTPVFREVGGDRITYVPPRQPHALARAIAEVERNVAGRRSSSPGNLITWNDSARALVAGLLGGKRQI